MTNDWPPPEPLPVRPAWESPQPLDQTAAWPPPQTVPQTPPPAPAASWPPSQVAGTSAAWPPPQPGTGAPWTAAPAAWAAAPQQGPTDDHLLRWAIPINRSGLAIAAGYVALVSIPFVIFGPVAFLLGILALRNIAARPGTLGKGRAWFAIVYGGLATVLLIFSTIMIVGARS